METPQGMVKVADRNQNFLEWFLDSKRDIEDLKYLWKGWERNSQGVWVKSHDSDTRRIMNDRGIHWATQLMESYLGRVQQSTNYDEEHMNFEMRSAVRAIWFGLITQFREFELSKVNTYVVSKQMQAQIHAILLSARANGIRDFLTKTHQVSEVRQIDDSNKSGFFSGIASMFNRTPRQPPNQPMY